MEKAQRLRGQVVVVTGAASGIGEAAAMRMLSEGASVILGDVNRDALEVATQTLRRDHRDRVVGVVADVAVEDDVIRLLQHAVDEFGQLTGLLNNAGLPGAVGPIDDLAADDWDRTMAVLLRGPMLGIKHAARQMTSLGQGGWITSTSSIAGHVGGAGPIAYSTAKAALIHLTRVAAIELGPRGIRVNCISPGLIVTPLVDGGDPAASAEHFAHLQAMRRGGQPGDIASAVVYLASDEASFVTGHALVVDGGLSIDSHVSSRLRGGDVVAVPSGFNAGGTTRLPRPLASQ